MKKRIISAILCIVIAVGLLAGTSLAEYEVIGEGTAENPWLIGEDNPADVKAVLNRETGELTISGTGEIEIGAHPWTIEDIYSIFIEKGITSIPMSEFEHCPHLTTVIFDNDSQLTYIGRFAICDTFADNLIIPENVNVMGLHAVTTYNGIAYFKGKTPPVFELDEGDVPDPLGVSNTTKLCVPADAVEAYKTAWADYCEYIFIDFDVWEYGVSYPDIICGVYFVDFAPNGGTGTMSSVIREDSTFILPDCGFEAPDGMTFAGWSLDGKTVIPSDSIELTGNEKLLPVWKEKQENMSIFERIFNGIAEAFNNLFSAIRNMFNSFRKMFSIF